MQETAQILAFQALRSVLVLYTPNNLAADKTQKKDTTLFEFAVKRMYNDFTKESKSGGGGFQVQDRVRVSQNCFTQILGLDLVTSYQLGFLYIRQLCLHIRNIRNNLTKDGIKNIYSW